MMANLIEQGENSSSANEGEQAQALAISRLVCNASPIYRSLLSQPGVRVFGWTGRPALDAKSPRSILM